jgi:hypothetical protein
MKMVVSITAPGSHEYSDSLVGAKPLLLWILITDLTLLTGTGTLVEESKMYVLHRVYPSAT